jgi:hypothetical protein
MIMPAKKPPVAKGKAVPPPRQVQRDDRQEERGRSQEKVVCTTVFPGLGCHLESATMKKGTAVTPPLN